jgi:hypothetical protein
MATASTPFNKLGKKPVWLAELQLAEQSTKICKTDHAKILEEMRQCQLLYYDKEEETEDKEADDVSSCDNNNSESEKNTSDNDT